MSLSTNKFEEKFPIIRTFIWNHLQVYSKVKVVGFNSMWCVCSPCIKTYFTILTVYRFLLGLTVTIQVPKYIIGSSQAALFPLD